MEDFRTSLFSDCSLMKTVTSTKKSWCAALPIRKRKKSQVHCKFELNRLPSTAATGSKSHSAHATHQSPNVDQLNITEVQIIQTVDRISMQKKCWQIQLNGKNQPNHRSEPAEPLDSPHESTISKRKFCSRRRLSTRTFVWIFAPFFSHLVPGPLRKLQFSFCKTSLIPRVHKNKSMQRLISSLWGPGTAKFQVT